jgi:hypothetical protein
MSSDRVIVDTIKMAQDLLRQNLPPKPNPMGKPHPQAASGFAHGSRSRLGVSNICWINQHSNASCFWHKFVQQIEAFRFRLYSEKIDAGRVAGWLSKAPNEEAPIGLWRPESF